MHVVIFRARLRAPGSDYYKTAQRMRELATEIYGCIDFCSVTEDNQEVTVSYWESEEQILAWKNDPEHRQAQRKGQEKWYDSYQVEVAKVTREYESE